MRVPCLPGKNGCVLYLIAFFWYYHIVRLYEVTNFHYAMVELTVLQFFDTATIFVESVELDAGIESLHLDQ
jgi:hypothetical protein